MCGERLPERGRRSPATHKTLSPRPAETVHSEKWVEGPQRDTVNPLVPPSVRADDERRERSGALDERAAPRERTVASEPPPSFLGLGNAEYERPPREISWRFWALMLLLLGVVALFGMQWRANHLRANQPEPEKPSAALPADATARPEEPAVRNEPAQADGTQSEPAAAQPPDKQKAPATDEKPAADEATPKGKADKAAEEPKPEGEAEPDSPKEEPQAEETRAAAPREFSDGPVKQADAFIAANQCNDALRVLRGAGDNPKAMTKMGAMYLTGTCVEPDRVTAYAWFSQAFAADPHNLRLESTRRSIWSQMTDEERSRIEAGYRAR
jgi:hypothetical protein